jgi:5-methylcytosine-specific restriction protein A
MASTTWTIAPGQDNTREEISAQCGGDHRYRGIVPLTADVVIYSDHDKAGEFGYDFDGWDANHELYFYTGDGASGDQRLVRGNRAIVDHKEQNQALRLMVAVGNIPGTGTRVHRYVGQFELDPEAAYVTKKAPGQDGIPRDVFVFRLRPIGQVRTDVGQLSVIDGVVAASTVEAVSVEAVPEAAIQAERTEFERTASGAAMQKEAALTARFREYLKSQGREVKRYKITTPAGVLFTDTADITDGVLYEAKGTAERMSVRLALGQVLDYGRYVKGAELAVLLPGTPAADLVELLESHGVGCVVEGNPGQFSDMTGLGRCQ